MAILNRRWIRFLVVATVLAIVALTGSLLYAIFSATPDTSDDNDLDSLFASQSHQVFEPALPGEPVILPDDFAMHPEYQHEWWHFFANVKDAQGNEYGVQWNYFRIARNEQDQPGWDNSQLYSSHVVISTRDHVWREQRMERGGLGLAGLRPDPFRMWIDNWSWRSTGDDPLPGRLTVNTDSFALGLQMERNGPYVLPGDQGYQAKHNLMPVASYNIQAPFIKVRGSLKLGKNMPPVVVQGSAWMSKEWGSGLLAEGQKGWDWFVLDLDQHTTLTVSRFRHNLQLPYVFATLSNRNGQVVTLNEDDVTVTPLHMMSLPNGKLVPLQWNISIPEQGINITTSVMNQHLWLPFALPYWQGAIYSLGSHRAQGFMQLTGY